MATTATPTPVRAGLACEHNGTRYEWGIITAATWIEWERKARAILRDNGIPDSVRAERYVHV